MSKQNTYSNAILNLDALLEGEHFAISKMATINSVLKQEIPAIYWVGFYLVYRDALIVGPYIGTPGCIHIDFSRGVCGKAARTGRTQIVADVHALEQGTEHIACDPASNSEIVVPVYNQNNQLIAVLDIDSKELGAFDEIDAGFLENIVLKYFKQVEALDFWMPQDLQVSKMQG